MSNAESAPVSENIVIEKYKFPEGGKGGKTKKVTRSGVKRCKTQKEILVEYAAAQKE